MNAEALEERKQRQKEMEQKIYNESDCIDKIKMNIRFFFTWLYK